jgi:hypothetical protein
MTALVLSGALVLVLAIGEACATAQEAGDGAAQEKKEEAKAEEKKDEPKAEEKKDEPKAEKRPDGTKGAGILDLLKLKKAEKVKTEAATAPAKAAGGAGVEPAAGADAAKPAQGADTAKPAEGEGAAPADGTTADATAADATTAEATAAEAASAEAVAAEKREPKPPMFHMRDGTRLAGYPEATKIRITTAYGPLVVPIEEVEHIRFAAALDEELAKKIDGLISQLGHEEFDLRESASEELAAIGVPALPALRKAAESEDEEIKSRAEKLAAQLEETVEEPDEEEAYLSPLEGDEDEVETRQFTVKGRVEEASFLVKTRYGVLEFRRQDILSIKFKEPLITTLKFEVPGNTFAARNQWVDTQTDLAKGERFELSASGEITLANYGDTKCGPEGTTNVGSNFNNIAAGALVAKIGDGQPFVVGSSYNSEAEAAGRLVLGVALQSGTVNGKFEVVLEKNAEAK